MTTKRGYLAKSNLNAWDIWLRISTSIPWRRVELNPEEDQRSDRISDLF